MIHFSFDLSHYLLDDPRILRNFFHTNLRRRRTLNLLVVIIAKSVVNLMHIRGFINAFTHINFGVVVYKVQGSLKYIL